MPIKEAIYRSLSPHKSLGKPIDSMHSHTKTIQDDSREEQSHNSLSNDYNNN